MRDSDNTKGAGDVPFVNVGAGHYVGFRCAECLHTKPTLGRRMQKVKGMGRQWVCKACRKDH